MGGKDGDRDGKPQGDGETLGGRQQQLNIHPMEQFESPSALQRRVVPGAPNATLDGADGDRGKRCDRRLARPGAGALAGAVHSRSRSTASSKMIEDVTRKANTSYIMTLFPYPLRQPARVSRPLRPTSHIAVGVLALAVFITVTAIGFYKHRRTS
jgi:hypothetical protein